MDHTENTKGNDYQNMVGLEGRRQKRNEYFTVRLAVRGVLTAPILTISKCENVDLFPLGI